MSVRRAQQEIDSREFGEWLAYMSREPLAEDRADYQTALLALITASAYSSKGKQPKLEDFLPDYWGERKPQKMSMGEMKSMVMAWANAANEAQRNG